MYPLINSRLRKAPDEYTENSFICHYPYRHILVKTEEILTSLQKNDLLADVLEHQSLAYWLLNHAPLSHSERNIIHKFLYQVDYY